MLKHVHKDEFAQAIAQGVVLVDFYTNSCGPCKMYAKVLEKIAFDFPMVDIVKVCGDDDPEILNQYEVTAVPTTLIFQNGELKERYVGLRDEEYTTKKLCSYLY